MKKIITLILATAMALLLMSCAITTETNENEEHTTLSVSDTDTFSKTQEEYIDELYENNLTTTSENERIENVIETFLKIEQAHIRNNDAYDCKFLVQENALNSDTICYRLSNADYQTAVNELLGWEIVYDDLTFSDFKSTTNGDQASASIVTEYRYYATDGFDTESHKTRENFFELVKENGQWLITEVTSNDPWELEDTFEYGTLDIESMVENVKQELTSAELNATTNQENYSTKS
jgi:hypothetical protein